MNNPLSKCCPKCIKNLTGTGCNNNRCECHVVLCASPSPSKDNKCASCQTYKSHSCCWEQDENPACNILLENHKQCCLCACMKNPVCCGSEMDIFNKAQGTTTFICPKCGDSKEFLSHSVASEEKKCTHCKDCEQDPCACSSKEKCCENCKEWQPTSVYSCYDVLCLCHSKPPVEENDGSDYRECSHGLFFSECPRVHPTPKVATSEKGTPFDIPSHNLKCASSKNKECICSTPHESEDWLIEEFDREIGCKIVDGKKIIDIDKYDETVAFISKSYQRGREEGEQKVKIMKAACEGACDQDKMKILSLAVQEIEKCEKTIEESPITDTAWAVEYRDGVRDGLEKAKEILLRLKK